MVPLAEILDCGVILIDALKLVIVTKVLIGALLPQAFTAATDIVPLLVPVVTLIELVVDVPVHPLGNTQV